MTTPWSLVETLNQSADALQRESAALAIGTIGDTSALPTLIQHLHQDSHVWVRAGCAEALGLLGDPQATSSLRSALSREKRSRVRRAIAEALMRLGDHAGVGELMWQLSSGNNYEKSEVMRCLVRSTAQPLGQDTASWWRYFSRPLEQSIGRPSGGVLELGGIGSRATAPSPRLYTKTSPPPWRVVCVQQLHVVTTDGRITRAVLEDHLRTQALPEACLLLIQHELEPPAAAKDTARLSAGTSTPRGQRAETRAESSPHALPVESGLTMAAAELLGTMRPQLIGLALSTDVSQSEAMSSPVRQRLIANGWLVIEGISAADKRLPQAFRLILIPQHIDPARPRNGYPITLLALLD